jgi:hypothetical protein
VSDETHDPPKVETPFRYHLELTPAQLKITHTALRSLLDDFGHEERDVIQIINEVLAKLPDDHAVRAIQLEREVDRLKAVPPEEPSDDGKPPAAA